MTTHLDHEEQVGTVNTRYGHVVWVKLNRRAYLDEALAEIESRTLREIQLRLRVGSDSNFVISMSREDVQDLVRILNAALTRTDGEEES